MIKVRARTALAGVAVAIVIAGVQQCLAQAQHGGGGTPGDNGGLNGSLSRADLDKLSGDQRQGSNTGDNADTATTRARVLSQATALASSLTLPCVVSDARLVVSGTRRAESAGKSVDSQVYEIACGGKMGYLLQTQGAARPLALTCLAAEEARAADTAQGKRPSHFCTLAENKDVYALVTSLIAAGGAGQPCTVQRLQYYGRSESTRSEYSEVVCRDGRGFLLRTAMPGSSGEDRAMSCAEAAHTGIKCRLTDPGPIDAPVTLDTVKEALAGHEAGCTVEQQRLIGQEDHLKRYVIEYRCLGQAHSKIAFVPLPGNANPYDSMTCQEAAAQGLTCTLSQAE